MKLGLPVQFGIKQRSTKSNKKQRRKIFFDDDGEIVFEETKDIESDHVDYEEKDPSPESEKRPPKLEKFYAQRYRLFSKYDEGIMMDDESWFSVTPEKIAEHHANKCKGNLVIDAFCGVGGNTIQLAKTCAVVVGIDIDPVKLEYARNNAQIYGVADRIEFILGDVLKVLEMFRGIADGIFMSPPWGGPEYLDKEAYDLREMGHLNGLELLDLVRSVCPNVAFFVPRNSDPQQLVDHVGSGQFELEKNYLGSKWKTSTIYFGNFKK